MPPTRFAHVHASRAHQPIDLAGHGPPAGKHLPTLLI